MMYPFWKTNEIYKWVIEPGIENAKGKEYELTIKTTCAAGEAPTVYYSADASGVFSVDGQDRSGSICFDYVGRSFFMFGTYYWYFCYSRSCFDRWIYFLVFGAKETGKNNIRIGLSGCMGKIRVPFFFSYKQLVARDFKQSINVLYWDICGFFESASYNDGSVYCIFYHIPLRYQQFPSISAFRYYFV